MRTVLIVGETETFASEVELVQVPVHVPNQPPRIDFGFAPVGSDKLCLCYDDGDLKKIYELLRQRFQN